MNNEDMNGGESVELGPRFISELDPRWPHAGANASVARAILWLRENRAARPGRSSAPDGVIDRIGGLRDTLRLKLADKDINLGPEDLMPGPITSTVRSASGALAHLSSRAPAEYMGEAPEGYPSKIIEPWDGMLSSWIDETEESFHIRFAWDNGSGQGKRSVGVHCETVSKSYPVEGMERVRGILAGQTLLCWDRPHHFAALSKAALAAGLDGIHVWPKAWRSVKEMFGIMFDETPEAQRQALKIESLLQRYAVSKAQIEKAWPEGGGALLVMRLHARVGTEIKSVNEGGRLRPFPAE
jgi:hypothetical protein